MKKANGRRLFSSLTTLVLVLVMLIGAIPMTAFAAEEEYHIPYAGHLVAENKEALLANGDETMYFLPEQSITRAEVAAMLFNMCEDENKFSNADELTISFSDVSIDERYGLGILYMAQKGIITGYSDGTFKPNNTITRAEFVTLLSRFYGGELASGTNNFSDVAAGHWAIKYINNAVAKGWVSGYPDGTFKPEGKISRAEAVVMCNRMAGRSVTMENAKFYEMVIKTPGYVEKWFPKDVTPDHWAYAQIIEATEAHYYEIDGNGNEIWTGIE